MAKQVIFFQGGGGQEDYDTDAKLVESLRQKLGSNYQVHYPLLLNEETPDYGRSKQIGHEISVQEGLVILVGHSLGASMLIKNLSDNKIDKKIAGVFLVATPFWTGDEDWVEPLKLPPNFADKINKQIPLFFYHCRDDKEVPFSHLKLYKKELPWATFREIPGGGHQINNDLTIVADDINSL